MASHGQGGHDGSDFVDLGPAIKSPLDSNQYKIIQLCKNGLRAFLISTIDCPPDPKNARLDPATCAYQAVQDFNSKYLGIPRGPQTTDTCTRKRSKNKNCCGKGKDNFPAPSRKLHDCITSEWRTSVRKDMKNAKCKPSSVQRQFPSRKENPKRCAVTLTIGSGNAQDPLDMNGLAHLVEHCLFLGSSKYPESGYFQEFCRTNGGRTNAATTTEATYYLFKVNKNKLSEGLEILTDFITNPLLEDDRIEGEIEAVDSEFRIRKISDDRRYQTLLQTFAKEGHPMGNFSCGNRGSLSVRNLGQRIREWKDQHYNGKNMVLSIQAEVSIEDLVELVVLHFSSIPSCFCPQGSVRQQMVEKYASYEGPFDPCKWNRIYRINPIANENKLRLTWVLPAKAHLNYKTKVNQFLAYLLTRKGPGSLDCYLRQKGWLQKICGPSLLWTHYMQSHFCTLYTLILSLTPLGTKDHLQVCLAVYSYVKMIRDSKAEDLNRIFEELKRMNADMFHYCSDGFISNPINNFYFNPDVYNPYVLHQFNEVLINDVDPKEVLLAKMAITEYDDSLIRECLSLMEPRKCNFILESKDLIVDCGNFEEKWFGIEYCEERLDTDFLKALQTVNIYSQLHLPPPNEFMQTSLCFPTDPREKLEYTDDLVVVDNQKVFMTYSNIDCQKGLLPSANYSMELTSSEVADITLYHVTPSLNLWVKCIDYLLQVKLAQALSALISVDVRLENGKLRIILRGPSGRLPQLFATVIATVIQFENELTTQAFENMKCMLKGRYENSTIDAIKLATELMDYVVQQRFASAASSAEIIEETRFEDFLDFVQSFKARMFVRIELSGCVSKSEAFNVSESVKAMEHCPWRSDPDLVVLNRGVQLPLGERCLRVRARNSAENNHMILNHYQFGIATKQKRLIAYAISVPMASRAFQYLRSELVHSFYEEKCYWVIMSNTDTNIYTGLNQRCELNLGYIASVYLDAYQSLLALVILVNPFANKFTPDYVDECIDDFLAFFYKEVVNNKGNYQDNIASYFAKEDRICWEDVKEFYGSYLLPKGAQYRKLTVQVVGSQDDCIKGKPKGGSRTQTKIQRYSSGVKLADLPEETFELDLPKACKEENGYFITDVYSFKSQQPCYPNLVNFADLPGNQ